MTSPESFAAHADETVRHGRTRAQYRRSEWASRRHAVAKICLEVEIAPAIDLAPPDDRFATHLTRAKPIEWFFSRSAVRVIDVVRPEELVAQLVGSVADRR